VQRIFEAVGVDTAIDHTAFYTSENTPIHRLMVQNFLDINYKGHRLFLGLGFAYRSIFSNTYLLGELVTFHADSRFDDLELANQTLCITVPLEQWHHLPTDIRIALTHSDALLDFCDRVLIPEWIENYAAWKRAIEPYLLRHPEPALLARLKQRVADDFQTFLKHHSEFEKEWSAAVAALGP
jgi:hypothetical protein